MKTLADAEWMAALLDPKTSIIAGDYGVPFRMVAPDGWDTGVKVLREHLIYFVFSGSCSVEIGGKARPLQAGELCWVCPGTGFRFFSTSTPPPVLLRFRLKVSRGSTRLRPAWGFRISEDSGEGVELARMLLEEYPGRFRAVRSACLAALLSMRVLDKRSGVAGSARLPPSVTRKLVRYVQDHPGERLRPHGLARLAGYSPDYFSRLFRRTFQMSPRAWILRQRLRHAAGLLSEPGWRIGDVAQHLGYPDVFLFSRQFKAEYGISPAGWRSAHSLPKTRPG